MENAFDSIISAIKKSEEIAQSERQRYKEVKEATNNLESSLHELRVSTEEMTVKKDGLEENLAEATIQLKLDRKREAGLAAELDTVQAECQHENENWDELSSRLRAVCQEHSMKVATFSKDWGLTIMDREKREYVTRDEIKLLQKEVLTLNSEEQQLTNTLSTLTSSVDLRSALIAELHDLENAIAGEEEKFLQSSKDLVSLTQRNKELTDEPEQGDDFINVAKKQQEYCDGTDELERQNREYQNELQRLTEELRKREGQALQQQYRNWKRQQQNSTDIGSVETSENGHEVESESEATPPKMRKMSEEDGELPNSTLDSPQEENE